MDIVQEDSKKNIVKLTILVLPRFLTLNQRTSSGQLPSLCRMNYSRPQGRQQGYLTYKWVFSSSKDQIILKV